MLLEAFPSSKALIISPVFIDGICNLGSLDGSKEKSDISSLRGLLQEPEANREDSSSDSLHPLHDGFCRYVYHPRNDGEDRFGRNHEIFQDHKDGYSQ